MKSRPGRNVVDMVVARLPSPDRLKERSGGRSKSYDDEEDDGPSVGEISAIEDFCQAIGIKPKDSKEAAIALRDFFAICDKGEDDEDDEEDDEDGEGGMGDDEGKFRPFRNRG